MTRGRRFLLLLFGAVAILAVIMSAVLSTLLTRTYLGWEGQYSAAAVRQHVRARGLDLLFGLASDPERHARWEQALGALGASVPEVVRCLVWDRDGAPLGPGRGMGDTSPAADPELQAALAGQVVAKLKESNGTEDAAEFKLLVKVHVPIVSRDDGRVLGVIAISKNPARLQAALRGALIAVWAVSLVGGVGAGVVAWALFRWADGGPASAASPPAPSPTPETTAAAILADIDRRFGFVPPFFEPAIDVPPVLENLWRQTLSAYVENPLPALFKEQLFAYLSRYCAVPYCIVCHSCALRPLGMTAGEVLALLETPPPAGEDIAEQLAVLVDARAPLAAWPASGSPLATALMKSAIVMFLSRDEAERCQAEARRLVGPDAYARLTEFLGYVKTCFLWVETHPELSYDADRRAQDNLGPLLEAEPRLREFFRTYAERVKRERRRREGPDA